MPSRIDLETEQDVINLYQSGIGVMEIAAQYHLHRATIQRILIRNDIQLRKRTPNNMYNIHFFDEYTPESCYWAGFIAADGYVRSDRNTVAVHLANADYKHLEKLANATQYTGIPKINKWGCVIVFNGEWFVKSLGQNFNIKPRKTFNISISDNIPKNMLHHFIRGYFDGDGTITESSGYARMAITSGSKVLLNQVSDFFYNNGVIVRNNTGKAPIIETSKSISYGCTNAFKTLDILYDESTIETRLDRKYKLYLNYRGEYTI